ncbi:hypothetical protein QA601_16680 [Chitinispirillales bacterium ANBcel5]|uniref:hypothetical protein n=1 Tax=Cellulosispirillum alkaliphilum TaxID=3039283 RepID=UPI002A4FA5C2|nr:hypothetical protein [Chitinispirillales bacterium ANBcel5]
MRKKLYTLTVLLFSAVTLFAQHPHSPEDDNGAHPRRGPGMHDEAHNERMMGMMMMGMCPMHTLQPQVIPTDDDGIVVVIGNRIVKFDSDLNQVEEVTVELSTQEMQQIIRQRAEMMNICREIMEEMSPEEEDDNEMTPEEPEENQ